MKKTFYLAAMFAAVTMVAASCSDDDNKGGGTPEVKVRIKTFKDQWEGAFTYTYGTNGKVTKVVRNEEGELADFNFVYGDNSLVITRVKGSDAVTFATISFATNGYIATMKDEWEETYAYTYDAAGFMTKVERDGDKRSDVTIENGNIKSWTRFSDDAWHSKSHTYSEDKNVAGIYNIFCERSGASRWLMETGMFGKPNTLLCESNKWDNSDVTSTITYDADDNGCVTKENKIYGEDTETYEYTWEEVK